MKWPNASHRALILMAVLGLVATACGSHLSEAELVAANGPMQTETAAGPEPGSSQIAIVEGSGGASDAGDATDGANGATPDGGAPAASGGSSSGGPSDQPGQSGPASPQPSSGPATPDGSAACPDPCAPIKFGSLGTSSGVLGAVTGPAVPAIRAWVADVNARGGLGGHQVEMIIEDVAGDPTRAVSTVRRMVEVDKVDAIFYDFAFGEIVPVVEYLDSVNVPLIGSIGGDDRVERSAMYFNPLLGPDVGISWGLITAYREFSDKGRLGTIYCRESANCSSLNGGMSRFLPYSGLGIQQEMVYDAQASLVQPNFTAEVIGAQQKNVEVLFGLMDTASLARIAQAVARQQGYDPILAGNYNLSQDLLLEYPELEGTIIGGRLPPWDVSPKLAGYRAAMARYQPEAPLGDLGAGAYVTGLLLEKYAASLPGDPGPADFLDLLYSIKDETLGGLLPGITFVAGDKSGVNQCVVPQILRNGNFVAHDKAESFVCAPGWKP